MLTFIWFIWLPGTQGNLILGVWLTSLPAKMTSLNVFTNCTTNSRLPLLGITRFLLSNRIRNFKFSKPSSFLRVQHRAPHMAAASAGRPDRSTSAARPGQLCRGRAGTRQMAQARLQAGCFSSPYFSLCSEYACRGGHR